MTRDRQRTDDGPKSATIAFGGPAINHI